MKRFGHILFCLLPLPIVFVLQNLISIPACGIMVIWTARSNHPQSLDEFLDSFMRALQSSSFTIGTSAAYAVSALLLFGFWYQKKLRKDCERIAPSHAFNGWIVGAIVLLSFGLQYVTTYIMTFVGMLFPGWMERYEKLMEIAGFDRITPLILLYGCVIAPVSEELIFRGVTLGYAKKHLSTAAAIALSAVSFGIFHMNIIQGIYAAFIGLFLGYLCEAGGSLAISIVLHACFNFCGTVLNRFLYYRTEQPFFFLLWLTVGVLLTFAGVFLFQHGVAVRDNREAAPL